jgi:tripeptide aminopeptidase
MIPQELIDYTISAYTAAKVEPVIVGARGGTDGAELSYAGLPTPNIFTGMYNFHSVYEFITLETMAKAAYVVVNLSKAD